MDLGLTLNESLTLVIAALAFFGSIVSILINILLNFNSDLTARQANKLAIQANDISNKALEISEFVHKGNLLPSLSIKVATGYVFPDGSTHLLFILNNESRGKATIIQLKIISLFGHIEKLLHNKQEPQFPKTLSFNNFIVLEAVFTDKFKKSIKRMYEHSEEKENDFDKESGIFLQRSINNSRIDICFEDESGTKYYSILTQKDVPNLFEGKPIEGEYPYNVE